MRVAAGGDLLPAGGGGLYEAFLEEAMNLSGGLAMH